MNLSTLEKMALEAIANFLIVDADGRITYMNKGYRKLLGLTDHKVIGCPVREMIPHTRMPQILETGKEEIGKIMTIYSHEKKENINVICNRIPLFDDQGEIIGAVAMTTFYEMEDVEKLNNEIRALRKENQQYRVMIEKLQNSVLQSIIGTSRAIMEIKKEIADFARSNLSILLTGETGVGKEVFANAIHQLSNRKLQPFVKINCASIPKDLLESELFGYEAGAFTGAKKTGKPGKFELADGGTLLLDEIGEMSMDLQSKLLRVLQEKEVEHVGGAVPKKVNVRIICSTNKDIRELIKEKLFREDLYYRVNTIELSIPPLRERKEDIPALTEYFIEKINGETGGHTIGTDTEVQTLLLRYDWPGNVRELEHTVERLCFVNPNGMISINDCDFLVRKIASKDTIHNLKIQHKREEDINKDLRGKKEQMEIDSILNALSKAGDNKTKAAKLLGISRQMLYKKIKKYEL